MEKIHNEGLLRGEMLQETKSFYGKAYDPSVDSGKANEILEYAMMEHGVKSPTAMLNFLMQLDHNSRQRFPKFSFVDRAWAFVNEQRALKALQTVKGMERAT